MIAVISIILISVAATLITGYFDCKNEARQVFMENNLYDAAKDILKLRYDKHFVWSAHRIVIFFATSIPLFYVNQDWVHLLIAAINFVSQMCLFRFWHDSRLQVEFGNKFTSDSDGLSSAKIDSKIKDTWENRIYFYILFYVLLMIEGLLIIAFR